MTASCPVPAAAGANPDHNISTTVLCSWFEVRLLESRLWSELLPNVSTVTPTRRLLSFYPSVQSRLFQRAWSLSISSLAHVGVYLLFPCDCSVLFKEMKHKIDIHFTVNLCLSPFSSHLFSRSNVILVKLVEKVFER